MLNKIDLVHPDELMPRIEKYKIYGFYEIITISALETNVIILLML